MAHTPNLRAISSAVAASLLHGESHWFESSIAHDK